MRLSGARSYGGADPSPPAGRASSERDASNQRASWKCDFFLRSIRRRFASSIVKPSWRGPSLDPSDEQLDSRSEVDAFDGGGLGDDEMMMTSRAVTFGGKRGGGAGRELREGDVDGEMDTIDGDENVSDVSDELHAAAAAASVLALASRPPTDLVANPPLPRPRTRPRPRPRPRKPLAAVRSVDELMLKCSRSLRLRRTRPTSATAHGGGKSQNSHASSFLPSRLDPTNFPHDSM
ncbi:hypothetical protein PaG_03512 [Moesziomyces aphidis]|uniref:Uncharacterized protein n=1 Tax=Moesziomyces aphidis TaxID=84754 RepID=W3VK93_MOEAP|nr:hypothetical protein PaG_03512 [Moesziomyces aphidis]